MAAKVAHTVVTPEVLVITPELTRLGKLDEIISLDAKPRWRSVAGWTLEARGDLADALKLPGYGIAVRVNKHVIFSGPTVTPGWGPSGTVIVEGIDDLTWLHDRAALTGDTSPVPLTKVYDDEAETSIYALVDDNLGPSASAPRRAVVLASDLGRGDEGEWLATGQPVFDLAAEIAASQGWGLQVRWQPDGTRLFSVLVPRDRTATVRLSDENESIGDWTRQRQRPKSTHVYVGGEVDDDQDERVLVDGGIASPWGRIETWEDARRAASASELEQVRDDALADGAAIESTTAEIQPVGEFSFPDDYDIGDLVSLKVDGEDRFVANVIGLDITELSVRPVLSEGRHIDAEPATRLLRDLRRRMARQETQ